MASEIKVDTISEKTSANGVAIDSVTLKDGKLTASGDTAAGDNATVGYTSAEGLILTGQGSTSDVTLKNDADGTVFTVPTGTDDVLFPDSAKAMWGASSDMLLYHDGTNSYITNKTGALKIATETSGIALTIGHTTSEVTIGDNLTTTGTMTVGSTGITANGITAASQWRLTADTNAGTDADVTSNWEVVDTDGYGSLGSAMTESSGIFTFPSTGFYLITVIGNVDVDNADTNAVLELHTTEDNSSYNEASLNGFGNGSSSDIRSNVSLQFMFDVTSTTTHKFKLATNGFATSTGLRGNTALNETCFSVIRLGDT